MFDYNIYNIISNSSYCLETIFSIFSISDLALDFTNPNLGIYNKFDKNILYLTLFIVQKPFFHNLVTVNLTLTQGGSKQKQSKKQGCCILSLNIRTHSKL
jgi:hypothetical protein